MIFIRGRPRVLFPLNYKLSMGVSSVWVQKRKPEDRAIRISSQSQHIIRCPLKRPFDLMYMYFCFFFFVNNVNIVNVEHFHV